MGMDIRTSKVDGDRAIDGRHETGGNFCRIASLLCILITTNAYC